MKTAFRFRSFAALAALIVWAGLALQFYVSIRLGLAKGQAVAETIVNYFSYFTVLTNTLAAVALTVGALVSPDVVAARAKFATFFSRPGVNTGIAAYSTLVGIAYSLLLRHTWNPTGLQLIADVLLHDVMPVAFLVYWWLAVPKRGLRWSDVARWALYPLGYLAYALGLGALGRPYLHPFIDESALGYTRAFLNSAGIAAAFVAIALMLIAVGRLTDRATVPLR